MPVYDTTSVIGGFGQQIVNNWALGDDRQFYGDVAASPNPPPPNDLNLTDAYFTLKSIPQQPDSDSLIQKHVTQSITSAGVISFGTGGSFTQLLIKIASGDYEGINNIVAGPAYSWDIRCITSGGVTFTVATGTVVFLQNDTQTNASGTPAAFPNNGQPRFRGFTFQNPQLQGGFPGFFNQGDFYYNSNPSNGNGSGWQCTIGGSPGTWIPFGGTGSNTLNVVTVPQTSSPFSASIGQLVLASASAIATCIVKLPAAIGSQQIIIVKKMDANAQNIVVTPLGTDTIDGVNAVYNNGTQYQSNSFADSKVGAWVQI